MKRRIVIALYVALLIFCAVTPVAAQKRGRWDGRGWHGGGGTVVVGISVSSYSSYGYGGVPTGYGYGAAGYGYGTNAYAAPPLPPPYINTWVVEIVPAPDRYGYLRPTPLRHEVTAYLDAALRHYWYRGFDGSIRWL